MGTRQAIQVIEEYTALDPNSDTPLYLQIRDGLGRWLAMCSTGQQIPPERELADALAVNRATVKKAMGSWVEDGAVVRRPKRGTILVRPILPDEPRPHPFNGAAGMTFDAKSTVPLSVALFENLPPQQQVWNAIVGQFNQDGVERGARIEWLPESVCTLDLYRTFIRTKNPDVVLLMRSFAQTLQMEDGLSALPADLVATLRGGECCSGVLSVAGRECLDHVVPVQMSCDCLIWNEDLAGTEPPSGWPTPNLAEIVEWLLSVAERTKADTYLTVNTRHLPLLAGLPLLTSTDDEVACYFEDSFTAMARLRTCYSRLHWPRPPDQCEYRTLFVQGKAAVFVGGMGQITHYLMPATFPWRAGIPRPQSGRYVLSDWNGVAVPTNCRNPEAAMEFVRFMVSAQAQDLIGSRSLSVPYRRTSQRHVTRSFFRDARPADVDAAVRSLRTDLLPFASLVCDQLDFLYRDVAQGKRSVQEAVGVAMTAYHELDAGDGAIV